MLIAADALAEKDQFVSSPAQFQLDSPKESPFEALPTISVVNTSGSFDINWVENPVEPSLSKAEDIFDEIVSRSRLDVERFPSNSQVRANFGVALMNRGQFDAAADEFLSALKLFPHHFMSLANLARIRTLQSRFAEAEQIYQQLATLYPKELSPLVNLSYILLRTGRFDDAALILKQAIDLDEEAAFPRYLMAVSQLKLSRPKEAIKNLRVVVRAAVRSPAAYQALGVAYVMAGDTKSAVRSFRTALTLAPDMKDAVHSLANVFLQRGDTDEEIELLSVYVEKQPRDIRARELLAEGLTQNKKFPLARLQLTTALSYFDGDNEKDRFIKARLMNNIGSCFYRQGKTDIARIWVEKSIATDPRFSATPHLNIAKLHIRNRQFVQAWADLETCKRLFPDNHEVVEVQALVLSEQGLYDEAIVLLRNEIVSGKATAGCYANLGWYLTDYKYSLGEACQVMFEGLKRYPQSPSVVNNLAYVLLTDGRPSEARSVLFSTRFDERKITIENHVALTATAGLLHLWEGDIATGQQFYEKAEQIALGAAPRDLYATVRQKKYLELAKTFIRNNDLTTAKQKIVKGLSVKGGRPKYREELELLEQEISKQFE